MELKELRGKLDAVKRMPTCAEKAVELESAEARAVEVEARAAAEREGETLRPEAAAAESAAECALLRARLQPALAAGEQLCSQLQTSAAECAALNAQLAAAGSAPALGPDMDERYNRTGAGGAGSAASPPAPPATSAPRATGARPPARPG